MRIAITGALGHIGSRLIHNLPGDAEIVMVDNFYTQRYASLFDLSWQNNYRFIEADILTADLDSIFKGAEVVIHLAAITDAESSFDKKELVDRVNFDGTKRVAQACVKANCGLIYASTTSVYGVSEDEVDETCTDLKPQSPYAEAKLKAEKMISETVGLRYVILRMGTLFGISPGMRFHTAVNKFCFQAALGQPLTVWSTAINQNRPYLDIIDIVRAIKFIIESNMYNWEIYNIVTINTTVSNIIDIIKDRIPNIYVNYVDTKIMNQLSYTVSAKKFNSLGFKFNGSLDRGINNTLNLLKGIK